MENTKPCYVMHVPNATKDEFLRECYLDLAKKTSSAEAISNIRLSAPFEMATVAIKHDVRFHVKYSVKLGHNRVERSVVEETHRTKDYSYTEEVIRDVHHVDWEYYDGEEDGVKATYLVPLKDIDHSPFWAEGKKPKNPYWKEQKWESLDPTYWSPASPEIEEKLSKVYFDANACSKTAINESGIISNIIDKLSKDTWEDFQKEFTVINTATTIGVRIDYRTQGEYKGQKFHIPRIEKEILPIPTQRPTPKAAPQIPYPVAPVAPSSVEAKQEELLKSNQEYIKSKALQEKLPLILVGSGILGLILSIISGSFVPLLLGVAVAALAMYMGKIVDGKCVRTEQETLAQAQAVYDMELEEYQKADAQYQKEWVEYQKACEKAKENAEKKIQEYEAEINQRKIEALDALFVELGMAPLSEHEKARLK